MDAKTTAVERAAIRWHGFAGCYTSRRYVIAEAWPDRPTVRLVVERKAKAA